MPLMFVAACLVADMGHADFVLAAEMRHQARESLRDKIEADAEQEKLFLMEELEGETLQLAFEDASHMDNLAELIRAGKILEAGRYLADRVAQHIELDVNQRKQARLRKEGLV